MIFSYRSFSKLYFDYIWEKVQSLAFKKQIFQRTKHNFLQKKTAKFQTVSFSVPIGAPFDVAGRNTSAWSLLIKWDFDLNLRQVLGVLLGFHVYYLNVNDSGAFWEVKTLWDPLARQTTLNGLKEYRDYNITVTAFTRIGDGAWSLFIIVRTDEHGECLEFKRRPVLCWSKVMRKFSVAVSLTYNLDVSLICLVLYQACLPSEFTISWHTSHPGHILFRVSHFPLWKVVYCNSFQAHLQTKRAYISTPPPQKGVF